MMTLFSSNTVWFFLLGVLTVIELAAAVSYARDRNYAIALFIIVSGLCYILEATVCCFLKAYDYFPMLLPSRLDDNVAGNLFSQFSITATSLLLAVLKAKYYWYLISALAYCLIEQLFLRLGIYTHNWWRLWMTFFGALSIFLTTKAAYAGAWHLRTRVRQYVFISFGLYSLHMRLVMLTYYFSGVVRPNLGIFRDAMSSYAFVSIISVCLVMICCMAVYFAPMRLWLKAAVTLALYGVLFIASASGFFEVRAGYFLVFSISDIFGMYLFIYILDRLLPQGAVRRGAESGLSKSRFASL
jgi:hypothetical protein